MRRLRVLVTAGPTFEYIDPIRIITNPSSGKMGMAIAKAFYKRGAEVHLVYGPGTEIPPSYLKASKVKTTSEMHKVVVDELKRRHFDMVIATAACADFTPIKRFYKKITSNKKITLTLKPTPKIIDAVKKISPKTFLVAFKAEYNRRKKDLLDIAWKRLKSSLADLIVVNDVGKPGIGFQTDSNEVYIIDSSGKTLHLPKQKKTLIAEKIVDLVYQRLT
jgi:phosphopantothenoylcysteine decarboxylase/phosphopantothenate--cysteine ligase